MIRKNVHAREDDGRLINCICHNKLIIKIKLSHHYPANVCPDYLNTLCDSLTVTWSPPPIRRQHAARGGDTVH